MFRKHTKAVSDSASKLPHQASSYPTHPLQFLKRTCGSWKGLLKNPGSALIIIMMILLAASAFLFGLNFILYGVDGASEEKTKPGTHEASNQEYGVDQRRYKPACPDYRHYAVIPQ